ncbi:MAG: SDR family oxidoreductase [Gemmatimonadaceae bacterium]|nr:SDR family oxidoreductase [Gemmatimonadaceae bacterium]
MTASSGHPLAGRSALVTGASRGIGRATAIALAEAGADVLLVARHAADLAEAAAQCGGRGTPLTADLRDADDTQRLVSAVLSRIGHPPDVLVNNAGIFTLAPTHELDAADLAAMLDTNLVAPFRLLRAFLPGWRARADGHVVTIGSVADRTAFPDNGAYAATKFGARALHEVLRAESQGSGVRCTLVSPGPVDTPIWDPIRPETREGFPTREAMLTAADVAAAVLFAVSRPPHVNIDELRLGRA